MIQKIAIFRALYLGDMLLAVPALRAIRQRFPQAEITLIGLPWAETFVERYQDYLDRFLAFPGYAGLPEVEVCQQRTQDFLEAQRAYHYDLALQMHGSGPASNRFLNELGAGATVGYFLPQDKTDAHLTLGASYPIYLHEIYRNLGLARMLGCSRLDPHLEFALRAEDFREIRPILNVLPQDGTPRIALHVGAKHLSRRWPAAYFAELADALTYHWRASILLTGGQHERSTAQQVIDFMTTRPINLVGKTSLGGLAALISELDLFISNDTGPAHLAYALDAPSITLFGPTDYQRWRPLKQQCHTVLRVPVDCSPCGYQVCPIDHPCLKQISPSLVQEVATAYLQNALTPTRRK